MPPDCRCRATDFALPVGECPNYNPGAMRTRGKACLVGLRPALHSAALAGVLLAAVSADAASEVAAAADASRVFIEIHSPGNGDVVENRVNLARVRGNVQSGSGQPLEFDVMIAIDVSHSTRFPSGIDVDEDEELGFNPREELVLPGEYPDDMVCTDPDDTILAAEVRAAHLLLDALDPARTQVAVSSFSGEVDPETGKRLRADQRDARLEQPLTRDFDRVREVLAEIQARGPHGATNFAAATKLAVIELAGLSGGQSAPRPGAKKVMLFLTDGVPTFPFGRGATPDPEDTEAAITAARLAHKAGITINSFALGRHALAEPVAVTEMARVTVGTYTPVRNPGDIVSFLAGVSFANVDDVVIRNLTTGEVSYDVELAPDGSFSGFVPVRVGSNDVEVVALASDGAEGSKEFSLEFKKAGLSERELAIELERIRKRNKELLLLLERKRIERFRDRQQRSVDIEADEDTP